MKKYYEVAYNPNMSMYYTKKRNDRDSALEDYKNIRKRHPNASVELRYHYSGQDGVWKVVRHANRGY